MSTETVLTDEQRDMSTIEKAIRAVREAESSVADVAGNMESALFLVKRCESRKETLQALEWASQNLETAKWLIRDALEAVREMDKQLEQP